MSDAVLERLVREVVALRERVNALEVLEAPAPISDHGALSGLGDDDHAQYLTEARHTGAHPACRVYHNAHQSIPDSLATTLAFNSERFDTANMHSAVDDSRLTCSAAGRYLITGHVSFAKSALGYRELHIVAYYAAGGSTHIAMQSTKSVGSGEPTRLSVATVWEMAVGDCVRLRVWQDSGGALAVQAGASYSPEFTMTRIAG